MQSDERLVSATELRKTFGGVSHMSLWRWLRLPDDPLPPPAAIISRRRFWRASEIETWLARRKPAARPAAD